MVSLFFGTKARGTASTNLTGAFSTTIGVPRSAPAGEHDVTATGETSSLVASATFTVVLPSIALSRTDGPPMANLTVTGANFRGLESVQVAFDSNVVAHATADQAGSFSTALRVPQRAQSGPHHVTATGEVSGLIGQATFSVRIDNWPMYGLDAAHSGYNPREDILGASTVGGLTSAWTATVDPGGGAATGFSSPAVVKGWLYIGSEGGKAFAINAWTGAVRWSTNTGSNRVHNWSAPAVVRGVVYIGGDNLYVLRASTGAVLWKVKIGGDTWSPAVANGVVYVGAKTGKLYAARASDGSILWTKSLGDTGAPGIGAAPSVANGVVYAVSENDKLHALDADTGKVRWTVSMQEAAGVAPAVVDGVAYAPTIDNLRALDASTGVVLWTSAVSGGGLSSPAVANGVVFVGGSGGLFAFDAATGGLLWNAPLGYCTESSPAVANGVVFVNGNPQDGSASNLYALDALTGEVLWTAPIGAEGRPDPRVVNGMVYSSSEDGRVYAFALP